MIMSMTMTMTMKMAMMKKMKMTIKMTITMTKSHLLGHEDTFRLWSEAGHQRGLVATHIIGNQVTMLLRLVNNSHRDLGEHYQWSVLTISRGGNSIIPNGFRGVL